MCLVLLIPPVIELPIQFISKDNLHIWARNQNGIFISALVIHIFSCPFEVQYAQAEGTCT